MEASGGGKYHPGFRFTRVGREMNSIGGLAGSTGQRPFVLKEGVGWGCVLGQESGLVFVWFVFGFVLRIRLCF